MAGPIACFGEVLFRLSTPDRQLMVQSDSLDLNVGGAEANVAVALACLGHPTRMVSALPDTALGDRALAELRKHGVDSTTVARTKGRMGLYFMTSGAGLRASEVVYDRAGSSFATLAPGAWDWAELLKGCSHLHLSGITPALGPGPAEAALAAAAYAKSHGLYVSFDGNYRARLWEAWDSKPKEILRELIGHVDLLFGNHKDVSLLLGRDFAGDRLEVRRAAAEAAFDAFPVLKLVASTARHVDDADRHRIAARIDGRERWAQTDEVLVSGIIDRIGTGDAFAAGVLHGLRTGSDLDRAAQTGLALACLKHSLPGDMTLFRGADIEAFQAGISDVRR